MSRAKVILPRQLRQYFAEIGQRGGQAGRRKLTPQQARLMVKIREAKRSAAKKRKPAPKLRPKEQQILRAAAKSPRH